MAGIAGAWAPIGAEKTASGYEVAWKGAGADQYTVWTTDNNGNYISNDRRRVGQQHCVGIAREQLPSGLNGDGQIGVVPTVIEANGATSLTQVGDQYYLDDSTGAGPSLKISAPTFGGHGRHSRRMGADWRGEDGERI